MLGRSVRNAGGIHILCQFRLARYVDASGAVHDEGIPADIDLLQKNADGSVKEITMDIPKDPDYPEDGNIQVAMPDYSEFYNIKRLSEEMRARNTIVPMP